MNRLNKITKKAPAKKQKPIPVKIVYDEPKSSPVSEDNRWRARSDLEALQRAKEIQNDKTRFKAAQAEAKNQMKNPSSVCKR